MRRKATTRETLRAFNARRRFFLDNPGATSDDCQKAAVGPERCMCFACRTRRPIATNDSTPPGSRWWEA